MKTGRRSKADRGRGRPRAMGEVIVYLGLEGLSDDDREKLLECFAKLVDNPEFKSDGAPDAP